MYSDGYQHITSIDFSETAIALMTKRANDLKLKDLLYLEMDARKLSFPDQSFDAVIDKGTIDAMMCGKNNIENVEQTYDEISRVLKPGGVFMLITYGRPSSRIDQLDQCERFHWKTQYISIVGSSEHFLYWSTKDT